MTAHAHDFGSPPPAHVVMCHAEGCAALAMSTPDGFRDLTGAEALEACAKMLADIARLEALQMVHGPERGLARFTELVRGREVAP